MGPKVNKRKSDTELPEATGSEPVEKKPRTQSAYMRHKVLIAAFEDPLEIAINYLQKMPPEALEVARDRATIARLHEAFSTAELRTGYHLNVIAAIDETTTGKKGKGTKAKQKKAKSRIKKVLEDTHPEVFITDSRRVTKPQQTSDEEEDEDADSEDGEKNEGAKPEDGEKGDKPTPEDIEEAQILGKILTESTRGLHSRVPLSMDDDSKISPVTQGNEATHKQGLPLKDGPDTFFSTEFLADGSYFDYTSVARGNHTNQHPANIFREGVSAFAFNINHHDDGSAVAPGNHTNQHPANVFREGISAFAFNINHHDDGSSVAPAPFVDFDQEIVFNGSVIAQTSNIQSEPSTALSGHISQELASKDGSLQEAPNTQSEEMVLKHQHGQMSVARGNSDRSPSPALSTVTSATLKEPEEAELFL
jgi:hypothetical protein